MDATLMARVLWWRRTLRRRERWTRDQLQAHQHRELAVLRAFATERSPFYRQFHRGLAGAPLSALPEG
jgi:phenylacetate-coenzyme A ligase PaaK-like adenylate-forming protein